MFTRTLFETKPVTIEAEGDFDGVKVTATDRGWQPFANAVAARVRGEVDPTVKLTPDDDVKPELDAFWRKTLNAGEQKLLYAVFTGPEGEAFMPLLAVERFAELTQIGWDEWKEENQIILTRRARAAAIQARVDAEPRTVDWSNPDPVVLDALEARVRNFDDLIPDNATTHILRELVYLAVAGAGILDDAPHDLAAWPRLRDWQQMAVSIRTAAAEIPELIPRGATSVLASVVGLDWFRLGPYAGPTVAPHAFLRWHLRSWLENDYTEPGYLDLFSREYSGRVIWRTGVNGVQQLCAAGKAVTEHPWTGQAMTLSYGCTQAKQPLTAVHLAARLAVETPQDWHAWTELGVALISACTSGARCDSLRIAKGPLDDQDCAGAGRECMERAIASNSSLRNASFYKNMLTDLEDVRIFHKTAPIPLDQLALQLVVFSGPVPTEGLKGALREDVLAFLAREEEAFQARLPALAAQVVVVVPAAAPPVAAPAPAPPRAAKGKAAKAESKAPAKSTKYGPGGGGAKPTATAPTPAQPTAPTPAPAPAPATPTPAPAPAPAPTPAPSPAPPAPAAPPKITAWTTDQVQASGAQPALAAGYGAVAALVAGVDGFDDRERAALSAWVAKTQQGTSPAAALLAGDVSAVLRGALTDAEAAEAALTASIAALNASVAAPVRAAYRDELRALGQHLAQASNGSWFAFWRPKVSDEERAQLMRVEEILRGGG
jgi:hypothetical protein